MSECVSSVRPGDVMLFENACSFGSCCIACWSRSDFDHVGIVYHGASVHPALKDGGWITAEIEAPHICEALSPECQVEPLRLVLKQVLDSGGSMFWRQLHRPMMEGEPALPSKGPWNSDIPKEWDKVIQTRMHRSEDAQANPEIRESFSMPGLYHFDGVKLEMEESNNESQYKGDKVKPCPIDLWSADSDEAKVLAAKLKDYEVVDGERRLKAPLSYREFNQSCAALHKTPYEERGLDVINAAIVQDASVWEKCCGACCCERKGVADKRTEIEKLATGRESRLSGVC